MSLNNTKKLDFINRTGNFSTMPSRRGVNLLGWGVEETMTEAQKRECLVRRVQQLNEQIKLFPKNGPQRAAMGEEIKELCEEISKFPKKNPYQGQNIADYIVQVVKADSTKLQWARIMERATRMKADAEDQA